MPWRAGRTCIDRRRRASRPGRGSCPWRSPGARASRPPAARCGRCRARSPRWRAPARRQGRDLQQLLDTDRQLADRGDRARHGSADRAR